MENPGSLEQNLNVLSRLMVDLKHTKDQVAIKGKWDMCAWLKNVREREWKVDAIMEKFKYEKTAGFSPNDLDAKDELNMTLIEESLTAVKVLIEKGHAGLESTADHLSSLVNYQLKLFSSKDLKKFIDFGKKLGVGGYSIVYQGKFEGEQVAVKVLNENKLVHETFIAERITMGRISHTNLVKLYGFCFDDDIKALVYEYMEKGSFDNILYKNPNSVDWTELYGIAIKIARGLAYLHHDCDPPIIHHDVKAANVLLDKNLCPKITDFGVSNLLGGGATHITNTRTKGTDCYAAPEVYHPFFPISCKCDVYSFGIMMFEILGRRCSIPIKVREKKIWFPEEVSRMLTDQTDQQSETTIMEYCGIMEKADREKAKIVLMVAMWCAQYTTTIRPSMKYVVEVLEKEIPVTTPPYPFAHHSSLGYSMEPSLQWTPEVCPLEVPVNDKSEKGGELQAVAAAKIEQITAELKAETKGVLESISSFFLKFSVRKRKLDLSRKGKNKEKLEEYLSKELEDEYLSRYSVRDLKKFTSGFSESNILGMSGFGDVYKGKFPNGVEVAIKVFTFNNDPCEDEFLAEVRTMSTLSHKNILRTYGYCFEQRMMALIYEYMPCGSLDRILFQNIEWGRLYNAVIEIAKGLSYLHDHRIIHHDIKPSNILLDENLSPKIRSSGISKLQQSDHDNSMILTNIRCVQSYIAPEMWMPSLSQVTTKADVYGFGMMMFEVLRRRKHYNAGELWFPKLVWDKFATNQIEKFIMECGIGERNREDAKILSMVALWCVQYTPDKRPSMGTVVNMLEKILPVTPPPYPFGYADDDDDDDDDDEKEEESEALLKLYEKKCPPGGENSVIIYTTTIERMRKSFKESKEVRAILQSHDIMMVERDVYGDVDYEDELNDVLGKIQIPVLFVKGRLIGAADEVKSLEAEGKLKVLLYGIPTKE